MKKLLTKFFSKFKVFFVSLPMCVLLLVGCGNLNYTINTNIVPGLKPKDNIVYLTTISEKFLNFPQYFADKYKIKDLNVLCDELYKKINVNDPNIIKELVQDNKSSEGVGYRFLFDHYDSILFYVNGTGSFVDCDPQIDGVEFCVGYGGKIKVKKGDNYYWFWFNDVLNKKKSNIDEINEITKIEKVT